MAEWKSKNLEPLVALFNLNPELSSEYARLKQALAVTYRDDGESYTEAKGPLIERVNMDALRSIDLTLAAIAGMLDDTAGEIRDAKLEPTSDHIHRIGRALAEVGEIRRAIFAVRPDLQPNWLEAERPPSPDNQLLARAMVEARALERNRDYSSAIALLDGFLDGATSRLHIDIARNEIQRLRGMLET